MGILKSIKKREGFKLVGASLPSRVHCYISLYALAKDISRSSIIKQVLLGWIDTSPIKLVREEERTLTRLVAEKIQLQWHIEKSKSGALSLEEFNENLREELLRKGIQSNYVRNIISEFNNSIK